MDNGIAKQPGCGQWKCQTFALLLAVVCLGSSLYLSWPDERWLPGIIPDSAEPYYATMNFVAGRGYLIQPDPAGEWHRPRYPFGLTVFFLAPVKWLGLPNSVLFSVTELCLLATVVFAFLIGLKQAGRRLAVPFAVGCLFLPELMLNARELLSHCPALMLFMAAWWALCSPTRTRLVLTGLCLGIGVTVRPAGMLLGLTAGLSILLVNGSDWRQSFRQLGWLAVGSVPFVVAVLIDNKLNFGGWLRTGYHYHCSVPYDFRSLLFNWEPQFLIDQLSRYCFPYNEALHLELLEIAPVYYRVVSTASLLLGGIGCVMLLWRCSRDRAWPIDIGFPLLSAAVVFAFHIPHVFFNPAFSYVFYVVLLWLSCRTVLSLYEMVARTQRLGHIQNFLAGSRRSKSTTCSLLAYKRRQENHENGLDGKWVWIVVGLLVAVSVGCFARRIDKGNGWDSRRGNAEIFHEVGPLLPQRCQIVIGADLNPLVAKNELVTTADRTMLPFDRKIEYAGKVVNRTPPGELSDPPTVFYDHRRAIQWGGQEIFATTFSENRCPIPQPA